MKLFPRNIVYFPSTLQQPKHNLCQYNLSVSSENRIASYEERLDYLLNAVEAIKLEREITFKQDEWLSFKAALESLVSSQPKQERRQRQA